MLQCRLLAADYPDKRAYSIVENSYNLNDIDIIEGNQLPDLYDSDESVPDEHLEDTDYEVSDFHVWHLVLLLILLILAAVVVVYVVMPFIASYIPTSSASQLLPNAVQA